MKESLLDPMVVNTGLVCLIIIYIVVGAIVITHIDLKYEYRCRDFFNASSVRMGAILLNFWTGSGTLQKEQPLLQKWTLPEAIAFTFSVCTALSFGSATVHILVQYG